MKMKPEITNICVEILNATKSLAETEMRLLFLAQEITLGDQFNLLEKVEILYEQKEIQENYLNTACANFSDLLKAL